ncbi:hypothetical protein FA15DRAFT_709624 [Coprinopsis marcescibilis]|uniref:Uncharacterized protein n=1 Tax=Coprinopsis marcescibilis TaxID=230819 RepID=A0A5C3KSG7_COPMA|nr:hypothetical protein FA15DRAFT_709624 [Coprinopsis marcescibilis]
MEQESKQHIPMNQPVPQPTFWSPAIPPVMTTGEQEMWDQFETGQYKIMVKDLEACHAAQLAEYEQQVQSYNLWAGLEQDAPGMTDLKGGDALQDEEELALLEALEAIGVSETDSLAILNQETDEEKNGKWAPYPSKLLFLLNAIDNMPWLRVSSGLMNVILWLLQEAGVQHVPKANALRKDVGIETIHWTSPRGNAYLFNSPAAIIANDWSNPAVRPHIHHYPSLGNGKVSEIWDREKWWHTLDHHTLSPMYDYRKHHYFIDEPARTVKWIVVIPIQWLEDDEGKNKATILDANDEVVTIPAADLIENILDLEENGTVPLWSQSTIDAGYPSQMPNPDRALAQGDPLYVSFIDVFGDDIHRNLPRRMLNKDSHIYFISTSPNATVPEQFQGIKTVIEVYDPLTDQYIWFKLQCNCGPGDNPTQSEASGHIGGGGNKPCQKCMVGGTNKERITDPGFEKIFSPGPTRGVTTTLNAMKSQVELACNGMAALVSRDQTSTGVKDAYTQFWIDKLFKILAQVNAFHTYDLVTIEQYRLVKSVGILSALLWFPEIYNMDEYLNNVNVAVANVLDSSAAVDPSKIVTKIKYHLLTHLVDNIKHFGPVVGIATKGYESFNGVFRLCSGLSIHQAPSCDIVLQLAKQEAFKHLASGGWQMTEGGGLVQPGFLLWNYVAENTVFQQLFNLPGHGNIFRPYSA